MRVALSSALLIAIAGTAAAQQPGRAVVVGENMQVSPTLSPGIQVGNVLYTSGQLGSKPGVRGVPMDSTIEGQTRQALENIKAVVEAGGMHMSDVTKCTVFLVDVKDFQGMNSVYRTYWPKDPPARSTVVVAALVSGAAKVEIDCIAAKS